MILVVTDAHSKWPEAIIMNSTTAIFTSNTHTYIYPRHVYNAIYILYVSGLVETI